MRKAKALYRSLFPGYIQELDRLVQGYETILDLGCGSGSPLQFVSTKSRRIGVDGFGPSIQRSKALNIHDEYHQMDLFEAGEVFGQQSFDCVVGLDIIEHFEKPDSVRMLEMMESLARQRVVIFTPNGFLRQSIIENNPWQLHRCGWTTQEFLDRGYKVIGINGWRPLRGESAAPTIRPQLLGNLIAEATQPLIRNHPRRAFQLLCWKDK